MTSDDRSQFQDAFEDGLKDISTRTNVPIDWLRERSKEIASGHVVDVPTTKPQSFCMASFLDRQSRKGMRIGNGIIPLHVVKLMYAVLKWRDRPCTCGGCAAIVADILG